MNNQNFISRESICSEFLDNHDDLKDLLLENNVLKEQTELLRKMQEKEKFEYESRIINLEREIIKLNSSLNSANEMIEVYKEIDKQNENSQIKEIVHNLKVKNNELEQLNILLKQQNTDVISELETLKIKIKTINGRINLNNLLKIDAEIKENEKTNLNNAYSCKNFNSIYSTNLGSSFNVNLNNQLSNETINFKGKIDNNYINSNNNTVCPILSNIFFENKVNTENDENLKENNTKENSNNKTNENDQVLNERENEMTDSASISSDFSFSSKNTNQLKEIFLKIKKDKNRIYDNAVELVTENEIEIKTIKNENEDLKFALTRYEDELTGIKTYLRDRHNINLDKNEILFNIDEKSCYENLETYISINNNQIEKRNLNVYNEGSLKRDLKANENPNVNVKNESTKNMNIENLREVNSNNETSKPNDDNNNNILDRNNGEKNIPFGLKTRSENTNPHKKPKAEDDRYLSSENHYNSFENEKNEYRHLLESLEMKLLESSKNYEEKISKLKEELENIELEKNQYQQELENIQSNKKNLVEDIEFYSVTVRSLQDQKEKLEDNLKNRIDYLIADNKCLEHTIMKNQDQLMLMEKENKDIKEKEAKNYIELKEIFDKEKNVFDAKFKELTIRYFECNKERESLKKDNENMKQLLERKKIEIDALLEKKLRAKEKKENEIKSIDEKFRLYKEKLESALNIKIKKYQEKIKSLYSIIENNIEKINSLSKEFNVDSRKKSKSTILNKEQLSKIKWTKNLLDSNFTEMKMNFNDIYKDLDLELSSDKIKVSAMECEDLQSSDSDRNENFNIYKTINEETKVNGINLEKNLTSNRDQKSNEASLCSKEHDQNTSPLEKKIKFLDSDNRKDNEFIDLYGFDPKKKHNSFIKSMNSQILHSEISSNSAVNSYINECSNDVPLALALEEDNSNKNKTNFENENKEKKPRKSKLLIKRKSSLNVFKKFIRENIKIKLKRRSTKKLSRGLTHVSTKDKAPQENETNLQENIKERFNFKLLKKTHEKEINELNIKISEYEEKIKKLQEEAQNIDNILLINNLKEKIMLLTQEKKNFKNEVQVLKTDLETLEQTKNEYVKKLKEDVEKAQDIAAKARFSMGQMNFEKDSEVLKYRNYCKKLRITIKTLQENNQILADKIDNVNSQKIFNNS